MKIINLLSLVLFPVFIFAGTHPTEDLPLHCYDVGYKFAEEKLVLGNDMQHTEQAIFLVQNITKTKIWLNHEVDGASASAGWATELEPNKWSALVLGQLPFDLICMEIQPGAEQYIPCQEVIKTCQLRHANLTGKNKDSYWAAENLTISQLFDMLERRGIKLQTKTD